MAQLRRPLPPRPRPRTPGSLERGTYGSPELRGEHAGAPAVSVDEATVQSVVLPLRDGGAVHAIGPRDVVLRSELGGEDTARQQRQDAVTTATDEALAA